MSTESYVDPSGKERPDRRRRPELRELFESAYRLVEPLFDPATARGGRRLDQPADGYVATIVSGEIIAENGVPTAARPGRLVRGRQPAPA